MGTLSPPSWKPTTCLRSAAWRCLCAALQRLLQRPHTAVNGSVPTAWPSGAQSTRCDYSEYGICERAGSARPGRVVCEGVRRRQWVHRRLTQCLPPHLHPARHRVAERRRGTVHVGGAAAHACKPVRTCGCLRIAASHRSLPPTAERASSACASLDPRCALSLPIDRSIDAASALWPAIYSPA